MLKNKFVQSPGNTRFTAKFKKDNISKIHEIFLFFIPFRCLRLF